MADPGEHEPKLRALRAQPRERLEQPLVVLVRPRSGGVEEERLPCDGRVGREALVVDREVDRVHALRVEPEPLDDPAARPLADHDHLVHLRGGAVVGQLAEQPLAAGEERGQVEVLDVEEGQDRRPVHRRDGDGEGIVDDVGAGQPIGEGAGAHRGARHRAKTAGDRRRGRVAGRHDRLEPAAGLGGERRDEHLVAVAADAGERAAELPRIRLRATGEPGHEREERQPDSHAAIVEGVADHPSVRRPSILQCSCGPRSGTPSGICPAAAGDRAAEIRSRGFLLRG